MNALTTIKYTGKKIVEWMTSSPLSYHVERYRPIPDLDGAKQRRRLPLNAFDHLTMSTAFILVCCYGSTARLNFWTAELASTSLLLSPWRASTIYRAPGTPKRTLRSTTIPGVHRLQIAMRQNPCQHSPSRIRIPRLYLLW